jgi:hypothetical protein
MRERWWVLLSLLAWLAFFAAALSAPVFDGDPGTTLYWLGIALQVLSVGLGVAFLAQVVFATELAQWPAWSRWAMFILGAATVVALWQLNLTGRWLMALHALALCAIAAPVGYWLGDRMQKASNLVPLGVAMAMADVFSVFQGPSKQIAGQIAQYQTDVAQKAAQATQGVPPQQAAQAVQQAIHSVHAPLAAYLAAYMPLAGKAATAPVLGIGDFIALAFIFRAAWVHRLNPGLVFGAALASALAALGLAQATHLALPALPLICIGTLGLLALFEPRVRRLDRQEIVLSVGVILLFAALIAAREVIGSRGPA